MIALYHCTFSANIHMVLAHPAFTEDQIESWSQPPASIMAKAPGEVFRMIVTIVKKYVEDSALNLSNLPLKAGSSIEVIILVQPASSADSNLYPPAWETNHFLPAD